MSDMKCPICKRTLQPIGDIDTKYPTTNYYCPNHCIPFAFGNLPMWNELKRLYDSDKELICTRKALDVAVDALKEQQRWLGVIRISMVSHLNNEKGTVFQPYDTDPTVLNIGKAKVLLNKALEQITTLEQKDVK